LGVLHRDLREQAVPLPQVIARISEPVLRLTIRVLNAFERNRAGGRLRNRQSSHSGQQQDAKNPITHARQHIGSQEDRPDILRDRSCRMKTPVNTRMSMMLRILVILVSFAAPTFATPIVLQVDATEAARKIYHAELHIP